MQTRRKGSNFLRIVLALSLSFIILVGCSKKSATLTPGEYTVDVKGMYDMKVKVTVNESEFEKIEIIEHSETEGIADEAIEVFPQTLIDSQDLTIDTISGATKTSDAIVEAVRLAIKEAGGNPEDFGAVTGEVKFKAGEYEGVAEGHNGSIKVLIETSETEILKVEVVESVETDHLIEIPFKQIPEDIVKHQTVNVDTVSGATVTSEALKNAVKDAIKNANVDPRLLNTPAPKELSDEVVELSSDVVVVGGGSAGLSAALAAEQNGNSVIVLEKNAMYGGHTALSGGYTFITGSKIQKELGVLNDTPQKAYDDVMKNGGNKSDHDMLTLFVENMGKATDWTLDYVGAEAPDSLKTLTENQEDRAMVYVGEGKGISDALVKKMDETTIEQYLNTKVEELIVEGDKVVGVIAKAKDGTTYNIKSDSVVLATGGHGSRRDLLPESLDNFVYYGASLASGDGVDMGVAAGANTKDMGYVELFENGVEWKPGIAKSTFNGTMAAWDTAGILVDRNGKRVVNERGMGPDIVAQQALQEDGRLFMLMDQFTFDAFAENIGGYGISDEMLQEWIDNNASVAPYFASGKTIEEVSKIVGVDAENLKATIETYNKYVENGKDEEFGRDPKYMTTTIKDGPYYLVEQKPRYATTLGGLEVNNKLQVLNKNSQVISGLYAVGDTAAGVRGDNSISGSDIGWAITSGYCIGDILAK